MQLRLGRGAPLRMPIAARSSAVCTILLIHAALLAWSASRHSATSNEFQILVAGMSHWQSARFDLACVNPPLVRLVATAPLALARSEVVDWGKVPYAPNPEFEFAAARKFSRDQGREALRMLVLARWACLPFSLLGGWICFRWARELYGQCAGILAMSLWCFSPSILASGQLIKADVASAALGAVAGYCFWHWLRAPTSTTTIWAGVFLGLALLAKTTLLVFLPLWPLLWIVYRLQAPSLTCRRGWWMEGRLLTLIFLLAIFVINVGYAFEGSLKPLGDYRFMSRLLTGHNDTVPAGSPAENRFRGSWLAALPLILPENYVRGIDVQRHDFEEGYWSYLRGEWRRGGWWYYYLYGLAVKEPLGSWLLACLALGLSLSPGGNTAALRDEVLLLGPLVALLLFVSSQTGFNHHVRYVLPILPFAFVWMSKVGGSSQAQYARTPRPHPLLKQGSLGKSAEGRRALPFVVVGALMWSVASSLWVYPHSLSYFNELGGSPRGGHAHLGSSNADCGQDLLYLKWWLEDHPEARPIRAGLEVLTGVSEPRDLGIECLPPPEDVPEAGWYAMSVNVIRSREGRFSYFLSFTPVAMAGYSICIYHITLDEANRLLRTDEARVGRATQASAARPGGQTMNRSVKSELRLTRRGDSPASETDEPPSAPAGGLPQLQGQTTAKAADLR